ncbi:ABC transporter permease [Burkholderia cenocepacia]|nr:ABC transporter permease [Burkholderia cenocepacia]ALV57064.1 sugar ABC transporter permease [Burkholderia cenocepacia]AQQ48923.1 sugar ABC transporter permease [Burkholderia cenocepacia]MBR8264580.1 ABC transporter permease [Burkholderia cenocepacia]ONI93749.1 sugar ABC transporter permease [Burkholderia cenocepacia]ONJ10012.1 sugar ABC transporter permease [Burkholderia cenocepacia]
MRIISPILRGVRSIVSHRDLLRRLVWRDIQGRYRGSAGGLGWAIVTPLVLLSVYTFVFSFVLKSRWIGVPNQDSHATYAIMCFSGLIVYSVFTECISRAPTLMTGNVNYVKKVVFPLEILPIVSLGSALFHFAIGFTVLLVFIVVFGSGLPPTAWAFWLVLPPLMLWCIGLGWILSSLGVFLRDLGQLVTLVLSVLMFATPIFYSADSLPEQYRIYMDLNPLSFVIGTLRETVILGRYPDPSSYCQHLLPGILVAVFGMWWFERTRGGFADVL